MDTRDERPDGRRTAAIHHAVVIALLALAATLSADAAWFVLADDAAVSADHRGLTVAVLGLASAIGVWATIARVVLWRAGGHRSSLVPLRLAVYVLVAGTSFFLVWMQPYRRANLIIVWGAFGGLYAALVQLGPALSRRLPRRALRFADLTLFYACTVALGVELGCRCLAWVHPTPVLARAGLPVLRRLDNQRMQPGQPIFGFPCDSRGYHDRELEPGAASTLIAAVGDSFSVGVVPHHFHYTTVCERVLPGVEIYNAGAVAIGPPEYLYILRTELLPLEPDYVLLCLYVGNDIAETERYSHEDRGLRDWFDRNNVYWFLLPRRLAIVATEDTTGMAHGLAIGTAADVDSPIEPDLGPERLIARYPYLADHTLEQPTFTAERHRELLEAKVREVFLPARLERYQRCFVVLEELLAACGETPLLCLLIPDEVQVDDELWAAAAAGVSEPTDRELPQRIVGEWLEQRGVPVLDPLPALRAAPLLADGKRHLYHLRDTHFNARGNEVLGRALAEFLRDLVK